MDGTAGVWSIADAKARFSDVVDRARKDGPQLVTCRGRAAVVIVSAEEWESRNRRTGSLADFFLASPLRGSGIDLERRQDGLRDSKIES
jgi:prevent-host-death family protein